MTKKELEQYCKLKREIVTINKRLDSLRDKDVPEVAGKVMASGKEFPYLPGRVSVQIHDPKAKAAINKTIDILSERLVRCNVLMFEIEEFIDGIEDSELRNIFTLRYIEGMKLKDIAEQVNLDPSGVSVKITRFLKCQTNQKKS